MLIATNCTRSNYGWYACRFLDECRDSFPIGARSVFQIPGKSSKQKFAGSLYRDGTIRLEYSSISFSDSPFVGRSKAENSFVWDGVVQNMLSHEKGGRKLMASWTYSVVGTNKGTSSLFHRVKSRLDSDGSFSSIWVRWGSSNTHKRKPKLE